MPPVSFRQGGAAPRVLLVDDSPTIIAVAKDILAGLGFRPESLHGYGSEAEALAAIEKDPPTLAFVDMDIGGTGRGEVVTRAILERRPSAKVVLITGLGREESAKVFVDVLSATPGPRLDTVIMNGAAAAVVGGKAKDFKEGVAVAREAIESGRALEKLRQFVEMTGGKFAGAA